MKSNRSRPKLINAGLIISSLIVYLEWGANSKMFLLQGEIEILIKLFKDPASVLHPFTLIPFAGQILLLITIFQTIPNRKLTIIGLGALSVFILFISFIGFYSLNMKVALSAVPFIALSVLALIFQKRVKTLI